MKKVVLLIALICLAAPLYARTIKRPLVEVGPKANLYIGDDVRIGFGAEVVFSPIRTFSLRTEITELSFGDYTSFYLNYGSSLDGLIYIPMRSIVPYVHAGMGFQIVDDNTWINIRAGMGLNYNLQRGLDIFVEPGIIIQDAPVSDTEAIFRLSFGGRFGILR